MHKEQSTPEEILFNDTDFCSPEVIKRRPYSLRRSCIIATLMHANISSVDVHKMMEAGMNVARIKTPNTTAEDKKILLGKVDKAATFLARKHGLSFWPCATCIELKTCIMKTGLLEAEVKYITINENSEVVLTNQISYFDKCNEDVIFVDNPHLTTEIKIGNEVSIAEDEIILKCEKIISDKSVKCLAIKGGKLSNMVTVCLPGAKRTRLNLTKKDLHMVKFAMENQVDMILVNYVRNPGTVKKIKQYIGRRWRRPIIIGGICTQEGLSNIDDLILECDGIMFSREFLAYELKAPLRHRMVHMQKLITGKCIQAGKPIYISGAFHTGLVDGIISDRDIFDVGHCILEGASGFLLKECGDIDNTVLVIKELNQLCAQLEPFTNDKKNFQRIISEIDLPHNAAEAAATSCALLANQTHARVIVLPTVTGRTAAMLLRLCPSCIIIAVTTRVNSMRRLLTYRSIVPFLYKGNPKKTWFLTVNARIEFAIEYAVKKGWILYKDPYVTLEKGTEGSCYCDTVRLWNVTSSKKHIVECPEDPVTKVEPF